MFATIYSFITQPKKTILLTNHTKNWRIWLTIIVFSGVLTSIKVTGISTISILSFAIIEIFRIMVTTAVIDSSAQIMGSKGHYKDILYWLAFASMVLWLAAPILIIKDAIFLPGSILLFVLNIGYAVLIWNIIKQIYQFNNIKTGILLTIPFVIVVAFIFSIVIVGSQWMEMFI